jgi:hypothetical protein
MGKESPLSCTLGLILYQPQSTGFGVQKREPITCLGHFLTSDSVLLWFTFGSLNLIISAGGYSLALVRAVLSANCMRGKNVFNPPSQSTEVNDSVSLFLSLSLSLSLLIYEKISQKEVTCQFRICASQT